MDTFESIVAGRLRDAVNRAGGAVAVAHQASVPTATLNGFLRGRDIHFSVIVRLAAACDVTLDWLATGEDVANAAPAVVQVPAPVEAPADLSCDHYAAGVMLGVIEADLMALLALHCMGAEGQRAFVQAWSNLRDRVRAERARRSGDQ